MCKDSWADLPKTPQNSKNEIIVKALNSKQKNDNVLSITHGTNAKTVE
jgi:hypothetical protein